MIATDTIKMGSLVLWHGHYRSYEGQVVGWRDLDNGQRLVHIRAFHDAKLVAVLRDRLTILLG